MDSGSKFLAYAYPIGQESETGDIMHRLKKEHPKARHFCTALRMMPDGSLERSNDDGEPSGSAGKPILGQLVKNDLTNVLIVVVRYFGGTKLGIPGLIEAYKTSTANALASARIIERKVYSTVRINFSYDHSAPLLNHIRKKRIPIIKESYEDLPFIEVGFLKSSATLSTKNFLQDYTQMDFEELDDYARYLHVDIEILSEEIII